MNRPLQGINALDLSRMWAVPGAAMYLADLGAEVIKVESLRGVDARRVYTVPPINGESRAFWVLNRNKRGIVVEIEGAGHMSPVTHTEKVISQIVDHLRRHKG